jgi:hypothetical protein
MMINGGYMHFKILFSMYGTVFVDTYNLFCFFCQHSSKMESIFEIKQVIASLKTS